MTRLFSIAGVDYHQWRALVRAYVWIDYAALFGAFGAREQRQTALRLLVGWGVLTFFGFVLAMTVWLAADPFFAAMTVVTTVMFWSALILLGQPAGLVAPADHEIVGFRPVTSRTLFAVRATAILEPCLESTVLMAWMPALAFASREDGSLSTGIAAAAGAGGAAVFVTLALVSLFGWLLRIVPPQRLARALSYAGAAAVILLTIAIVLATNHAVDSDDPRVVFETVAPRDWRTLWFPGAWFASYVLIANGTAGTAQVLAAALSVGTVALIAVGLRGRVAAVYSERVAELETITSRASATRWTWHRLRGETRAVALLVASHLRRDLRFQLAIASNLTMGVLFTVMTTSYHSWPPGDPFVEGADSLEVMAPLMALFFVPSQIYQSVIVSMQHEATWFYFSTPANRAALVIAARDAIAALVFGPALVLLTVFYAYAFGHVLHAVVQVALLGLLGLAAFQGNIVAAPRLPFSVPMAGTRFGGLSLFAPILVMVIGTPLFVAVQLLAYRGPLFTATALTVLVLVNLLLAWLLRRRLARNPALLAYSS